MSNSQVFDVCCSSECFSWDGLDIVLTQVSANEQKQAHKNRLFKESIDTFQLFVIRRFGRNFINISVELAFITFIKFCRDGQLMADQWGSALASSDHILVQGARLRPSSTEKGATGQEVLINPVIVCIWWTLQHR